MKSLIRIMSLFVLALAAYQKATQAKYDKARKEKQFIVEDATESSVFIVNGIDTKAFDWRRIVSEIPNDFLKKCLKRLVKPLK